MHCKWLHSSVWKLKITLYLKQTECISCFAHRSTFALCDCSRQCAICSMYTSTLRIAFPQLDTNNIGKSPIEVICIEPQLQLQTNFSVSSDHRLVKSIFPFCCCCCYYCYWFVDHIQTLWKRYSRRINQNC